MNVVERTRMLAIGYLMANHDALKAVDLNAFEGWQRTLVSEMKKCVEDPKSEQWMLRKVMRERLNLSGDGKLSDILMERIQEYADIAERIRCGGDVGYEARVERALKAMSRRQSGTGASDAD